MAISKLALIGGSAGLVSATAGGVVIYLNSGESIRDHITKQSASNRKFISSVSAAKGALKAKYSAGGTHKPIENGQPVSSEKIIEWCERAADAKFFKETDDIYSWVDTWCFVDITSFAEKVGEDKKDIVGENGEAEGWKAAWETYKNQKDSNKLVITTNGFEKLNTLQRREEGGKELYRWCQEQKNKKMYEVNAENIYSRYEKWCFQQ